MIRTAMFETARTGWQLVVLGGALIACEAAPPAPEVALPPLEERATAGAPNVAPASGGAPSEAARDIESGSGVPPGSGGHAPKPAGSGASGMGGRDTGSGGSASGAGGGSDGGRDGDSQSGDEQRYAILLGSE